VACHVKKEGSLPNIRSILALKVVKDARQAFCCTSRSEIDFSPECTNLALPDILCFVLVFIATTLNIISVMRWPPPNCQPVRRCQDSIDWFGTFLYRCHGWSYVPDGAKVTSSYFDDFVPSVFLETDENGSVMVFMTKTKVW